MFVLMWDKQTILNRNDEGTGYALKVIVELNG